MYPYITLFEKQIPVYGICLHWGFALATILVAYNLRRINIEERVAIFIALVCYIFGFVGASFFAFIEKISSFSTIEITSIFASGKNVYGGLIFALIGLYFLNKFFVKTQIVDFFASITPPFIIGYSIGRLGCFFAGDGCYGIQTDSIFGMTFPNGTLPTFNSVFPTPLFDFIILFVIGMILQFKFKGKINSGFTFSIGLIFLGIERFIIEFIRRNEVYFYLTQSQWISLGLIIFGTIILIKSKK